MSPRRFLAKPQGSPIFAFVGALGCAQVSGFDFRTEGESETAFPQVAYLDGEPCRSCLEEKCRDELGDCAGDLACWKTLEGRRECKDPDCHRSVGYPDNDVAAWEADKAAGGGSFSFLRRLEDAARDRCTEECSIGRSWGCVGRYDWRAGDARSVVVRHRAFVPPDYLSGGIRGAEVRACTSSLDCGSPLAQGRTDDHGFVELIIGGAPRFEGFLRVDARDHPPYDVYTKVRPRYTEEYTTVGMVTRVMLDAGAAGFSTDWDPARGYFWPQVWDCAGLHADDVTVELLVFRSLEGEPEPCEDCTRTYLRDAFPDPSADRTATRGGNNAVMFNHVEAGSRVVVTARDVRSGRVVSELSDALAPGRITSAGLLPLTRIQDEERTSR